MISTIIKHSQLCQICLPITIEGDRTLKIRCQRFELTALVSRHKATLEDVRIRKMELHEPVGWASVLSTIRGIPNFRNFTMAGCSFAGSLLTDF